MGLLIVIPAVAAIAAWVSWSGRRARARLRARLRDEWGTALERERDFQAIADYHRAIVPPEASLDDRTWNDLLLDDVFCVVDRTRSAIGRQVLYARLRRTCPAVDLNAFEALVGRFDSDRTLRERVQIALAAVADPGAYHVHRLARPGAIDRRPWHAVFPLVAIAMACALGFAIIWPRLLIVVAAGVVLNLLARVATARRIGPELAAFRQVGPLLAAAHALLDVGSPETAAVTATVASDLRALRRLGLISRWVSRDPLAAGDLLVSAMEYLNLLFLLDANALYFAARELDRHGAALLRVIAAVGEIDAAIAVASWRAALAPGHWTRPVFVDGGTPAAVENVRHPLVENAIPNSLSFSAPCGLLVTGSNMSGKSTLLRTVGINAVLAQTVNTCVATTYRAPRYVVRSCIGRGDDLLAGKSYYLVEVESVLRLVEAASDRQPHLFLFDELFRGTNAVERISASEAVLRVLLERGPHVVLAATHDLELVDLLADAYRACHFGDEIAADGLRFDYRLLPGRATSRNAIALLKQCGAPESLVERARERAERLDRTRALNTS